MYNYDHDCPFEAYITNLGKYNEGELVGEWVKFPTTYEDVQKVFERIGIDNVRYEEWFITDYDSYVAGIHDVLGEYESLDELNYLATKIEEMDKNDLDRFEAAIEVSDYSKSAKDLINLTDNLDKYDIYPDVHDHDDLGRMYIEEYGSMEVPDHLKNHIDYEAYGRDIAMDEIGQFTDQGYVRDTGDSFTEYYNGSSDDIPGEYRVMTNPEDVELSEDEKLDMATELAFDLDEFFRQKDPQYAATHPDAHTSKELIADLLLEGKTAAIKDRLAEMAQTTDDELPSRIGSYEQATGYEAYLDTDVAAIRNKLEQAQELAKKPIVPDDFLTGYKIKTPRGSFSLTTMTVEQMQAAGYGYHHSSDDSKYHIMGNGTRAFAVSIEPLRTYDICQLKDTSDRRDYAFEPLDRLHEQGRKVDMQNYDKVYSGAMLPDEKLESIYTRFNVDHPQDFTGHSLSVSDVVVIHENGQDAAHYCDSFGFAEVPEFLEQENHLKNAEMAMEDDYGMIDGIINNGPKEAAPPGVDEKGECGENGQLTAVYVKLITERLPDFFVLENVKGLYQTKKHKEFYESMKRKLYSAGYSLFDSIENALEYGVPQNRDRLILVGLKRSRFGRNLRFGLGQHKLYTKDQINDVPWPRTNPFIENGILEQPDGIIGSLTTEYWFRQNNVLNHPNGQDIFSVKSANRFVTIPEGDSGGKSFKRLHRWRYSPTAAYGNNEVHLHPYMPRRISVAEALAIQSLPAEFDLPIDLPLSAKFKMVGNGVPYLLALGVANALHEWIDGFLHRIGE